MTEQEKIQGVAVKIYRSADRVMVAAPLPGLQPEDIIVKVTEDGRLILQGELRGLLKDIKELVLDEWTVGSYYREVDLPNTVNGEAANVSYGNGVIVVALPIAQQLTPATLKMEHVGPDHGQRAGNAGHV